MRRMRKREILKIIINFHPDHTLIICVIVLAEKFQTRRYNCV